MTHNVHPCSIFEEFETVLTLPGVRFVDFDGADARQPPCIMSEAMCVQLVVARDALRGHGIRAPAAR